MPIGTTVLSFRNVSQWIKGTTIGIATGSLLNTQWNVVKGVQMQSYVTYLFATESDMQAQNKLVPIEDTLEKVRWHSHVESS